MKFNYEYRTSDNVRHQGVIAAANREAAFAALKAQGVRPGCLAEAPGFFNKLFGKGKRWLAIGVLGAGCLVLGAIVHSTPAPAPAPAPFTGSPAYLALKRDSLAILSAATNDVGQARKAIRELFRERYKYLADDPRERAEAQTLYGSIVLRLELLEE